jgi:hypothetical protein
VIELAFAELQPRDMDVVGLVAHTVGTTLRGAVYSSALGSALVRQSSSMKAQVQQEELRDQRRVGEQSQVLRSRATLENQTELEQTNEQPDRSRPCHWTTKCRAACAGAVKTDLETPRRGTTRQPLQVEFLANAIA